MNKRTDWVDYAKAIGIILVVYGHVARGLHGAGFEISEPIYKLVDSIVYSFHMPLFFFLSGLFFYSSLLKRKAGELIFSKVDTILYPYLIWSLFQGSIEALLSNYTNGNASLSDVLSLLWSPRAQFWFLYALFFIFVVSAVVYSWVPKKFNILVFVFAVFIYLFPTVLPDSLISYFISQNLVYFTFGIVFTKYIKVEYFSGVLAFSVLLISFVVGQWFFHQYLSMTYTSLGPEALLLALTSILFLVSISFYLEKLNYKLLAFIGASSMAIYMMHILAASGARIIFGKLGVSSFSTHIVLGCLVGIFVPLFALAIINRFKIPYVFSAPLSVWVAGAFSKAWRRVG